jgi:predicted NUDIX family NTP pyrophosphohydrolase
MDKKIRGVALIVKNPKGEILILKELESNLQTGKQAGMFSIPMETLENQEDDASALIRLIEEELPGFKADIQVKPVSMGVYYLTTGASASLYVALMPNFSLPVADVNSEVGEHRWINPVGALDLWLRQGAREMIADYIAGVSGIIRLCKSIY